VVKSAWQSTFPKNENQGDKVGYKYIAVDGNEANCEDGVVGSGHRDRNPALEFCGQGHFYSHWHFSCCPLSSVVHGVGEGGSHDRHGERDHSRHNAPVVKKESGESCDDGRHECD
jgi:hypothetical protein